MAQMTITLSRRGQLLANHVVTASTATQALADLPLDVLAQAGDASDGAIDVQVFDEAGYALIGPPAPDSSPLAAGWSEVLWQTVLDTEDFERAAGVAALLRFQDDPANAAFTVYTQHPGHDTPVKTEVDFSGLPPPVDATAFTLPAGHCLVTYRVRIHTLDPREAAEITRAAGHRRELAFHREYLVEDSGGARRIIRTAHRYDPH